MDDKNERALDSLIQTVRIFNENIGTQFGADKCAMLVMKKGRIVKSDGIQLPMIKQLSHQKKEKAIVFRCAGRR